MGLVQELAPKTHIDFRRFGSGPRRAIEAASCSAKPPSPLATVLAPAIKISEVGGSLLNAQPSLAKYPLVTQS